MTGAGEALQGAVTAALRGALGIGIHEAGPVRAATPHATVEPGAESDWGHKSGEGRSLTVAVTLHDEGESAARLRRLMAEAETAVGAVGGVHGGWRIVSLRLARSLAARRGGGWSGLVEYRARMLRA